MPHCGRQQPAFARSSAREAVLRTNQTVMPPSTTRVWPVTNAASSESRNLTGPITSSGVPSRCKGVRRRILSSCLLSRCGAHLGSQVPRGNRIDSDLPGAQFPGEGAGHGIKAPLGRPVDRHPAVPPQADDRGDVDDRSSIGTGTHLCMTRLVSVKGPRRFVAIALSMSASA